jgi:hypothetical protein
MRRSFRVLPVIIFGVLVTAPWARADAPTKKECAAANETAQDLRSTGKLRQARERLAICTADTCPGPIREDCAQRLEEVEAAVPSLMIEAVDLSGHDLSSVRVTMDGVPLTQQLGGRAIEVDPGEHRFIFDAQGFKKKSDTVVVREGERNRSLRVVLESIATQPVALALGSDGGVRRALGITMGATGAAGIVLGAIFGLVAKSTYNHALSECGGEPNTCAGLAGVQGLQDRQTAGGQAAFATVDFVVGAALLAGGAALYFTAPGEGGVAVAGTVSNGGGGLAVRGKW